MMRGIHERRGVAVIYLMVMMTLLLGFAALAVDWGRVQMVKTQLLRAADAGARAAASQLDNGVGAARGAAVQYAGYNGSEGGNVAVDANTDVEFGTWDSTNRSFSVLTGSAQSGANAVRVWARRTSGKGNSLPLTFGAAVGMNNCDVSASSIALRSGGAPASGEIVHWGCVNYGTINGIESTRASGGSATLVNGLDLSGNKTFTDSTLTCPFKPLTQFGPPISSAYTGPSAKYGGGFKVSMFNATAALNDGSMHTDGWGDIFHMFSCTQGAQTRLEVILFWEKQDFNLNGNLGTVTFDHNSFGHYWSDYSSQMSGRLLVRDGANYYVGSDLFTTRQSHTDVYFTSSDTSDGNWAAFDPATFTVTSAWLPRKFTNITGVGLYHFTDSVTGYAAGPTYCQPGAFHFSANVGAGSGVKVVK